MHASGSREPVIAISRKIIARIDLDLLLVESNFSKSYARPLDDTCQADGDAVLSGIYFRAVDFTRGHDRAWYIRTDLTVEI